MNILRSRSRNLPKIAFQISEISSSEREDVTLASAAANVIYGFMTSSEKCDEYSSSGIRLLYCFYVISGH